MSLSRREFEHDDLTFSYLDAGGDGPVLITLHAHLMEALTYAGLAAELAPQWRVVALDQRGHGHSSHAASYTRADYLGDIEALLAHLGLQKTVILGNSLGGVNAYQFAARYPDRVSGLIIEDIGAVISDEISFVLPWEGVFATRRELEERIGARFVPYLEDSIRSSPAGWRLAFKPRDMVLSQHMMLGDHWGDWLATSCPALLLRGRESRVTTQEHVEQMARRRKNTQLLTLDGGHALHVDNPKGFHRAVHSFLGQL